MAPERQAPAFQLYTRRVRAAATVGGATCDVMDALECSRDQRQVPSPRQWMNAFGAPARRSGAAQYTYGSTHTTYPQVLKSGGATLNGGAAQAAMAT